MPEKEEKLQKLYLEFRLLEQHIRQLENQSALLNNQLADLMVTIQALKDIKDVKPCAEILVPLSTGIYAKAELKDSKNFIVNVGSDVALIKNLDSTKELIESQVNEVRRVQENISNALRDGTSRASLLEQEINKILNV